MVLPGSERLLPLQPCTHPYPLPSDPTLYHLRCAAAASLPPPLPFFLPVSMPFSFEATLRLCAVLRTGPLGRRFDW